jgi:hypothetical protein
MKKTVKYELTAEEILVVRGLIAGISNYLHGGEEIFREDAVREIDELAHIFQ